MVKQIRYILAMMLIALFSMFAYQIVAFADYQVIDSADLFFSDEKKQIEQLAESIDSTYKMNVLVLTDQERNGKSARLKALDSYEAVGFSDNNASGGITIIIDMGNREVNLGSDRSMERFLDDDREEVIYDIGYGFLSNGEYGDAMIAMLEQVITYLEQGVASDQYTYDPVTGEISRYLSLTGMDLCIALGCALILPLIVVLIIVSGYKKIAKYKYDLNANSQIVITGQSDRYVKSYTTKRRINTGSSGGGGGSRPSGGSRTTLQRSSSGRTYGGGHGRKF